MQHARATLFIFILLAACGGGDDAASGPDGGDEIERPDASGGGGGEEAGCGPWNCDGCCDGDSCRPGGGDDECGAGGAACQACGRWGACGQAAVCELAPETRWDVVMESATVSPVNHGGTNWDGGSDPPDVYVRATVVDPVTDAVQSERTDAEEDLAPSWDETLFAELPGGALEGMQIEILDSDGNADDSMGICTAAVRLEDAEAGALELDCPRSLATGTAAVPPRAGWTLRIRLEPRSTGRPDAPALERHALAALTSPPGSCVMTWTFDGEWEATYTHDDWGREIRREEVGAQTADWDCSADSACEAPGALPVLRQMEPGPFGRRVRAEDDAVSLYDSLGRLVTVHRHDGEGRRIGQSLYTFTARRRVYAVSDLEISTTDYDERGSPILSTSSSMVQKIDLDADGLPVRYRISESSLPEYPVDSAWEVAYEGTGCAAALAARETNGALRR